MELSGLEIVAGGIAFYVALCYLVIKLTDIANANITLTPEEAYDWAATAPPMPGPPTFAGPFPPQTIKDALIGSEW